MRFKHVLKAGMFAALLHAAAGAAPLFTVIEGVPAERGDPGPRPLRGAVSVLDFEALRVALAAAPQEEVGRGLLEYGLRVALPGPDGRMEECAVAASSVLAPELQAKFPQMRTYLVGSVTRPEVAGRIEVSPRGLTAMLRTQDGAWMIDPWQARDAVHVVSYMLHDLPGSADFLCETKNLGEAAMKEGGGTLPAAVTTRRDYRMAMACTGEFGVYHSELQGHAPNIADPLAAIVTMVSRTNVVFEADMTIRFTLVPDNDVLVFIDPVTDPYPSTCGGGGGTDCSGAVLNANPQAINSRIGVNSYDVGHCVTRIVGGVAYLRSVCTNNKAGGVSGIPRGGDVDPLAANVVIHELGHQFGANHTFSGQIGRCNGNINGDTSWEAGSGSSPMSYAGGCPVGSAPPSDNVAVFADPFFHSGSVLEMRAFVNGANHTCPAVTVTSNNEPVLTDIVPAIAIPPGTPFTLFASATDADGNALTYSWEQFDPGVQRQLISGVDNGAGALFRIFPPVSSGQRTFPRMADVLAGVFTPGERLPTVTGVTRRFRVIVRDNAPGSGGQVISDLVNIEIAPDTFPFRVTAPGENAVRRRGPGTVTWQVSNTAAAPINMSSVRVELSTDGGQTFPTLLGIVPNTGSATVTFPEVSLSDARLRLKGPNQIFFAVSRPFRIESLCEGVDINDDGAIDFFDYLDFVNAFSEQSPASDFNLDGVLDFFDYLDFVEGFSSGC